MPSLRFARACSSELVAYLGCGVEAGRGKEVGDCSGEEQDKILETNSLATGNRSSGRAGQG